MPPSAMIALALALAAAAAFCGWRGARQPDLARGPRLAPWRPLMALLATLSLMMLIQLARHLSAGR